MAPAWCPQCQRAVKPSLQHAGLATLDAMGCGCLGAVVGFVVVFVVADFLWRAHFSEAVVGYVFGAALFVGVAATWARWQKLVARGRICPTCGIRL